MYNFIYIHVILIFHYNIRSTVRSFFNDAKYFIISIKPQTPLEQEIAMVLQSNSHMLERNNKELSQEEEEALKTMSLEEVLYSLRKIRKFDDDKNSRMRHY